MRSRFYFFAFWFVMIAEFVDRGDFVFALVCFVVVAMNVFMEIFPTPRDFTLQHHVRQAGRINRVVFGGGCH